MLVMPNKPNWLVLTVLGAIAGLFHGYAYGESIIGAGMTFAYLLGFTLIQYTVALVAFLIGVVSQEASVQSLPLRLAGDLLNWCFLDFLVLMKVTFNKMLF